MDQGWYRSVNKIYTDAHGNIWVAHNYSVSKGTTSLISEAENIGDENNSILIYPNPCSSSCVVQFLIEKESAVIISVYDVTGKLITSFPENNFPKGENKFLLPISELPSGIYLCQISVDGKNFGTVKFLKAE